MAKRAVTIKEVAEQSGVSRTTVSAVIHGRGWVSEDTRSRVLQAMQSLRYQQPLVAQSLSRRFSKVVGVVIGNLRNPFNTELLARLQVSLEGSGYFLINHSTDESLQSELDAIRALEEYELGAYVIAPVPGPEPSEHLRELVNAGKTVVTIGTMPGLDTHVVDFDDQTGARIATSYLIEAGHRRITYLAGPEHSVFTRRRTLGYLEGLMKHRVPLDDSLIVHAGDTMAGGYEVACRILSGNNRPTALLCFNDLIALSAYRAAYDLGLRIPDDLSVIGFDDVELANVVGPPLTTVATFPGQLGEYIAEIIQAAYGNPNGRERHAPASFLRRHTKPRLVERRSVCAPRDDASQESSRRVVQATPGPQHTHSPAKMTSS